MTRERTANQKAEKAQAQARRKKIAVEAAEKIRQNILQDWIEGETTTAQETIHSAEDFLALLDKCKAQVAVDPGWYTDSPHLYELQHKIYLRLCGGNIPDNSVTEGEA